MTDKFSIINDVKGTNPRFASGMPSYTENCQRCVNAYELRRRGYKVTARPILHKNDCLPYAANPAGWPFVYVDHKIENCAAGTGEFAKRQVELFMRIYGDGSRAIVEVDWYAKDKGHLFIAENHNGNVFFVDPQTGSLDVSWYFDFVNPLSVVIMRIDRSEFTGLVKACFE